MLFRIPPWHNINPLSKYVLDRFTENSSLPRMPSADCWDYEEIPHFLTEEIPHYKTRTAPKNSPCFSIRVRQYHLFYFYALYVVDLAVTNDINHAVHNDFLCLLGEDDVLDAGRLLAKSAAKIQQFYDICN